MDDSQRGALFVRTGVRSLPETGVFKIDESAERMQWNENPADFPDDLKAEVLRRLGEREWARYPTGMRAYDLMDAVGRFWNVDPATVLIGNGSSDVIRMLMSAILEAGDHVVLTSPTFLLYRRYAKTLQTTVHELALSPEQNFALPTDDLIVSARTNEAKLVVVCAPNNPTGTVYSIDELKRIADESGSLLLIDEAYADFCQQDLTPLLRDFDSVVLVRTFSKAYAMAGVRVGYALAAPSLAVELQKVVNVFTLSHFAELTALVALENHERFAAGAATLCAERDRIAQALAALPGVEVFESGANFLLIRTARPAKKIQERLLVEHNILISDVSAYPELNNFLRISVGTTRQNDRLIEAMTGLAAG